MPGLSKEQVSLDAALMRGFLKSAEYDCWKRYLTVMEEDWTARMRRGSREDFDYYKGILEGLRMSLQIPENVVRMTERR